MYPARIEFSKTFWKEQKPWVYKQFFLVMRQDLPMKGQLTRNDDNPHAIIRTKHRQRFLINIWMELETI